MKTRYEIACDMSLWPCKGPLGVADNTPEREGGGVVADLDHMCIYVYTCLSRYVSMRLCVFCICLYMCVCECRYVCMYVYLYGICICTISITI